MVRSKRKSFTNTNKASKDKSTSVSQLDDRLRAFANFVIDRIIEEQNKVKLVEKIS
ncbi:hypothetical protein ACFLZ1_01155 [Patescibacteria group bacterium]